MAAYGIPGKAYPNYYSSSDVVPDAIIASGLISSVVEGLAIDTTVSDRNGILQKAKNSVVSYSSVESAFPGVFTAAKMVEQTDGTLKYNHHNLFLYTDDTSVASWGKTGATVASGASYSGDNSATTITTSATTAYISQVAPAANHYPYRTVQIICKAGTSNISYIEFYDSAAHRAYFNLTTGAVGTVDAGVTATINTTDSDGEALPTGYFRVTAGYRSSVTAPTIRIGLADTDGAVSVTIGRTILVERMHLHFGLRLIPYIRNSSGASIFTAPIHPTHGVLFEIPYTISNLWSDDLSNAAWTKTNVSATLTTTGPDSEPCTTLTATAGNGTALQTTSNAYSAQTFSAYIKRRTGTGNIFITADNGSTWTNVTSLLVADKYTRVKVHGVANPTVGFKVETNGDAIDISKAICVTKPFLTTPLASYSTTISAGGVGSTTAIAKSLIPYSSDLSLFVEWVRGDEISAYETSYPFSLRNTAGTQYTRIISNPSGQITFGNYTGGATVSHHFYTDANVNARMSCSLSIGISKQAISINGDPPLIADNTTIPAWDVLALRMAQTGDTAGFYLRRFLAVPGAVDIDSLRSWKWDGTHASIIDCRVVTPVNATPDTTLNREPSIFILGDNGSYADFAVVHLQRNATGHMAEAPARLVQRNYRFVKSTGKLSALTGTNVIASPTGFSDGLGHMQSPSIGLAPIGVNAGKYVLLYTQLDSAQGTFSPDLRNVHMLIGDGTARGWVDTGTVVLASQVSSPYLVLAPGQGIVVLPSTHAVAPNRMVVLGYVANGCYGIYSDDGGVTWSIGNKYTNGTYSTNEPTLSLGADGSLIATHRTTTNGYRTWSVSSDAGVTFVDQGVMNSANEYQCAAGATQIDPAGAKQKAGIIAISRPSTAARYGLRINKASGPNLSAYSTVYPWNSARSSGYSALASIFGGTHLILASEAGIDADRFSIQVCVVNA